MEHWLIQILRNTALAYCHAHKAIDQESYIEEIRSAFTEALSERIIEETLKFNTVQQALTAPIYDGKVNTILKRICITLFRTYIECKEGPTEVLVGKKNFEKLNVSQAKFTRHAIALGELLFKEVLTVMPFIYGKGVSIQLALLSQEAKEPQ